MKTLNNKGFMLVETLIVTTIVASFIIFMYAEVHTIINNFNRTINYNTAHATYAVGNVRKLIYNDNNLAKLTNSLEDSMYVNVITTSFSNQQYSDALFNVLDVKRVIMVKNDVNALKKFDYTHDFTVDLQSFIKALKQEGSSSSYMLILELNNGEFANLLIGNDAKDNSVTITGDEILTASVNTSVTFNSGLTAMTTSGTDVSHLISCVGDVDMSQAGDYTVSCFVNNHEYSSNIFTRKIEVR